jgi:hypothetical protein
MTEPLEYVCCDCGWPVVAWGHEALPEPQRCGTCAWIVTLPIADQQPARERLGRPVR